MPPEEYERAREIVEDPQGHVDRLLDRYPGLEERCDASLRDFVDFVSLVGSQLEPRPLEKDVPVKKPSLARRAVIFVKKSLRW